MYYTIAYRQYVGEIYRGERLFVLFYHIGIKDIIIFFIIKFVETSSHQFICSTGLALTVH